MFLAMLMFLLDYGNVSYFLLRLAKNKINVKVLASYQSCREKRKTKNYHWMAGERENRVSLNYSTEGVLELTVYQRMTLNLVILISNVRITAICYYIPQLIHAMFTLELES